MCDFATPLNAKKVVYFGESYHKTKINCDLAVIIDLDLNESYSLLQVGIKL